MKRIIKINVYTIIGTLIYIITFFNTNMFNYNILKYICMIVVGLFLVSKSNLSVLKKHVKLNSAIILFLGIVFVTSFFAKGLTYRNSFFASLVFGAVLIELVTYLEIMIEKNLMELCLTNWYHCAVVITIITDVLLLVLGQIEGVYFVGTKFSVVYQHLFLMVLFLIVSTDKLNRRYSLSSYSVKSKCLIILVLTIIISLSVDCATGLIGTILLFCFCIVFNKIKYVFSNPIIFIFVILMAYGTMWIMNILLLNKGIAQFVTTFLNRELTLTGRTIIFSGIPKIMRNHWLMGFGYGSSYEICIKNIGYADAQNGLMEWILQVGVIGTSALLLILYLCMKRYYKLIRTKDRQFNNCLWIVAIIYVYIILGIVEITYSMQFIGLLLVLYSMSEEKIKYVI